MTILVGCSGWSYDDWVGKFYPPELARKRGEWFSYYAQFPAGAHHPDGYLSSVGDQDLIEHPLS